MEGNDVHGIMDEGRSQDSNNLFSILLLVDVKLSGNGKYIFIFLCVQL